MFHNGNCSLLSTLAMGWKGFLLQCKPSSDVVFVQCHFAATSRCLLCFFVLAPCFPCPVGVHILSAHTTRTLWRALGSHSCTDEQQISHGLAGGGQRCFQHWAVPQEPWAVSLPTTAHLQGQATSWDNLCTGRLECSPESLMQSSGSPVTQKNPPAFSNGTDRLVLVHLVAGGYSRYFCLQLPAQPFHTRSLWL